MGMSGLPDIYTQSTRDEGVYIRQAMSVYGITNINFIPQVLFGYIIQMLFHMICVAKL